MKFVNTNSELFKAFEMGSVYHRRSKEIHEAPYPKDTKSYEAFKLGYQYDSLIAASPSGKASVLHTDTE